MGDSGERSAQEYLAKHKILELFENLIAALVFERPGKLYQINIVTHMILGPWVSTKQRDNFIMAFNNKLTWLNKEKNNFLTKITRRKIF